MRRARQCSEWFGKRKHSEHQRATSGFEFYFGFSYTVINRQAVLGCALLSPSDIFST